MTIIRPTQTAAWHEVLRECPAHDFYHLPDYHLLAESRGEGEAVLFARRDEGFTMALPLLTRPAWAIDGLADVESEHVDATSVYGYAGPIASAEELPPAVIARFHEALRRSLLKQRVTTVFSRLHPLLPQASLIEGLGETIPRGRTVSIDLTQSPKAQRAGYRYSLRRDLRLLGERGVTCVADSTTEGRHTFGAIYREAMTRLRADATYFFDDAYFDQLAHALGDAMQVFLCVLDGRAIAGGVFTAVQGIAQAHLTGCLNDVVKISPQKLLYEAGAQWARERGCRHLHLGGGVGSREDSLFHFKLGFSHTTHLFATWQWVVDAAAADSLTAHRTRWMEENHLVPAGADYFPSYRMPATRVEAAPDNGSGAHARTLLGALLAGGFALDDGLSESHRRAEHSASSLAHVAGMSEVVAPRARPHFS
jgi:hypothetical protein